jgi:tripartite-type tricarboxylate transporter receptor subunit TctC
MNNNKVFRRFGVAMAAAMALMCGASGAHAAAGQVTLVVPFAAGGPADLIARKVAVNLGPQLGTTVIVDNRPGANGMIGVQAVSRAAPDGETLLFATSGMLTISPVLYKKLSYDPLKDLTPIARLVANGTAFLVGNHIPANNMKEFVAYASKSAVPLPIGSAGNGNITHLYVELLQDATKSKLLHVPYKGVSPAMTDVMGGQIAGVFVDLPAALPMLKGGKVKALGLVGSERSPSAPELRTIEEQGYKGVDGVSWFGVLGPAKMSSDKVQTLHAALVKVMAQPDMVKALKDIGSVPALNSPQEMQSLMRSEQQRWGSLIRARNIVVEE